MHGMALFTIKTWRLPRRFDNDALGREQRGLRLVQRLVQRLVRQRQASSHGHKLNTRPPVSTHLNLHSNCLAHGVHGGWRWRTRRRCRHVRRRQRHLW